MAERTRVAICAAVGLVVVAVALTATVWELALLLGWITTTLLLLAWIWWQIRPLDPAGTRRIASRVDAGRTLSRVVIVVSSLASLGAVVLGLHRASRAHGALQWALTVAALLTVVLSWTVVHTFFVLRYAHLYYADEPVGGIEFPSTPEPCYRDFAYLGFTVGMTYQVSDTVIHDRQLRAAVMRHALLSYVFGTAIVASTISVLASLII
ncbi:MAG: DUF1345 domain-containing protein [Acidimicrobiales bacterium]